MDIRVCGTHNWQRRQEGTGALRRAQVRFFSNYVVFAFAEERNRLPVFSLPTNSIPAATRIVRVYYIVFRVVGLFKGGVPLTRCSMLPSRTTPTQGSFLVQGLQVFVHHINPFRCPRFLAMRVLVDEGGIRRRMGDSR